MKLTLTQKIFCCLFLQMLLPLGSLFSQQAYFVDGYHGGVYGHYPKWQTQFMVDQLKENPDWKISLEIETETWDSVKVYDAAAYRAFQSAMSDPEMSKRIDIVNPSYGQAYLYNISGESIIRQFDLGIRKMHEHFPGFTYSSYSSEEPCFTSALPQILKSFGFENAVLKNPNTCWGGYTKAFGGELVNWIGPDGTAIKTVTRYESETFEENSTWQTTAWGNSEEYIHAALEQGIVHPVGMCLQDAGWEGGPWLGAAKSTYRPSQYVTWTEYFRDIAVPQPTDEWDLSQEDVQVSLVWGSQVLQRLAQQVRISENTVTVAEKLAAFAKVNQKINFSRDKFDEAWRTLLLSQHHDCWIVPYNNVEGSKTWADKVSEWTLATNQISEEAIGLGLGSMDFTEKGQSIFVNVFNSQGTVRDELVKVDLPIHMTSPFAVYNSKGKKLISQALAADSNVRQLVFKAVTVPMGITTFELRPVKGRNPENYTNSIDKGDDFMIESDLYKITIDPEKGGVITSMIAKGMANKELVDSSSDRGFNELRGFFYEQGEFLSSADRPATVELIENGELVKKISVKGFIGEHPFVQYITLNKGDRKIDFEVGIDWEGSPGIGEYSQMDNYEATDPKKAFYNDEFKLLVHFPLAVSNQQIYKNAPFDVTRSELGSTFFTRWDSIKNNIVLNWVDLMDEKEGFGVALFTDHTTSYAHAADHPLALNIQYSGRGLWGRDYKLEGPTHVKYALVPHTDKWDESGIWMESVIWNEPLLGRISNKKDIASSTESLLQLRQKGLEITSVVFDGGDLLVRLFNAEAENTMNSISFSGEFERAELVELNGEVLQNLEVDSREHNKILTLDIPRFGIRTIKLKNFR